jgi:MFS family permease
MTLMIYFAREFGASGTAIGWLIAAPSLVGLLRLWAPRWIEIVRGRRRFCVAMFLASASALAALPMVAAPGMFRQQSASIMALGTAWTAYQVFEFFGVVALWSWLGDLVPAAIRGRFIGRREACMTAGAVAGSMAAAGATLWWAHHCQATGEPELVWKGYAACASFGAAMLALAALPLTRMHEPANRRAFLQSANDESAPRRCGTLGDFFRPWTDARFRRLMYFGLWFSTANGLAQSPRSIYIASVLKIDFAAKRALDGASRGFQVLLLPRVGRIADRRGNVPVLFFSWTLVSLGSLFFLIATPSLKWWIAGAYVCWIAYAGLNVTLPNLMLGLSPSHQSANYAAAWFAWTNLAYSMSVLTGGWLFDRLAARWTADPSVRQPLNEYVFFFGISTVLMLLGLLPARRVPEPDSGL